MDFAPFHPAVSADSVDSLIDSLGYALIQRALPERLWARAAALVSAMWGVGTLLGPAAGGLFAQYTSWRWAFGALAILTAVIAIVGVAQLKILSFGNREERA